MSFLQQYDRLFLLTLGLVAVLRGVGGLASFFVVLLDPAASTHGAERSQSVVLASMAILHSAVLLVSGAGLLLRRPFGWKLSVAFQANELGKLAGALLITLLLGANADSIRAGTRRTCADGLGPVQPSCLSAGSDRTPVPYRGACCRCSGWVDPARCAAVIGETRICDVM